MAKPRRHRQGSLRHSKGDTRRGARAVRKARPRNPPTRFWQTRQNLQRRGHQPGDWAAFTEDVIAAVGRGELASADVIKAAIPEDAQVETPKRRRRVKRAEEGWFGLGKVMGLKFRWPGSSSGRSRPVGARSIP